VEIGVYIRDDQRSFVLAKTKWFTPKIHVDVGKALCLLSGLTWVQELQLGIVDFELDSKIVVSKFHSTRIRIYVSEMGDIIRYCRHVWVECGVYKKTS
jgi:hypothetical protein